MTQMNFKNLIEKAAEDLKHSRIAYRRKYVQITGEEFSQLFKIRLNQQLAKRRKNEEFIIDDNNKTLINELYYYVVGSDKFEGDREKGLMILGNLGSGKTLIMLAFCEVWNDLFRVRVSSISAKLYVQYLLEPEKFRGFNNNSLPNYEVGTVFIDDIGKESKKVNVYGTEICPIADLLSARYDRGAITFSTGNYTLKTLKDQYGETVTDRMKEMFNIIVLKGNSRRK